MYIGEEIEVSHSIKNMEYKDINIFFGTIALQLQGLRGEEGLRMETTDARWRLRGR